jgi:hypothetical protein
VTSWDRHRPRRRIPGSEWPAVVAMVPLGIAVVGTSYLLRGVRWLTAKLDRAEADALADWNAALSGVVPNTTIDKLIEEEDNATA